MDNATALRVADATIQGEGLIRIVMACILLKHFIISSKSNGKANQMSMLNVEILETLIDGVKYNIH